MKICFGKSLFFRYLLIILFLLVWGCGPTSHRTPPKEYLAVNLQGEINDQILVITNISDEILKIKLDVETKSGKTFSRKIELSPGKKKEFGRFEIGMRWEVGDKYTIIAQSEVNEPITIKGICK